MFRYKSPNIPTANIQTGSHVNCIIQSIGTVIYAVVKQYDIQIIIR
jgi:hypothetical protein